MGPLVYKPDLSLFRWAHMWSGDLPSLSSASALPYLGCSRWCLSAQPASLPSLYVQVLSFLSPTSSPSWNKELSSGWGSKDAPKTVIQVRAQEVTGDVCGGKGAVAGSSCHPLHKEASQDVAGSYSQRIQSSWDEVWRNPATSLQLCPSKVIQDKLHRPSSAPWLHTGMWSNKGLAVLEFPGGWSQRGGHAVCANAGVQWPLLRLGLRSPPQVHASHVALSQACEQAFENSLLACLLPPLSLECIYFSTCPVILSESFLSHQPAQLPFLMHKPALHLLHLALAYKIL